MGTDSNMNTRQRRPSTIIGHSLSPNEGQKGSTRGRVGASAGRLYQHVIRGCVPLIPQGASEFDNTSEVRHGFLYEKR